MDLSLRGTAAPRGEPAGSVEEGARPTLVARSPASRRTRVAVGAVLMLAVFVRFAAFSHLWLDEALTVNIARLPLSDIPEALRHDGAPPLYYFVLHAWMAAFGDSTFAVRALSGLFSLAALPLTWMAAYRLGGRRVAWAAALVMAVSPFAARYATEARMYSLIMVLTLVAFTAVFDLLEGSGRRPAIILAVATGLALLTHYWAFYLVGVTAVALIVMARRAASPAARGARRALLAMAAGGVLFLPWVPSFLYQMRHTGTPWAAPGQFRAFFDTVTHFAGGYWNAGIPLGLLYFALIGLALFGLPVDGRRVLLELRPRTPAGPLAAVTFGTVTVAILAGRVGGSAFAVRYAAVLFPLFVLLVALGTDVFVDERVRSGLLALLAVLSLWACVPNVVGERTAAPRVANALDRSAQPGDLVVYCPDQLGPSVTRELDRSDLAHLTFPRAGSPELIDWVDYRKINRAARTSDFARMVLDRAGPSHDIWVVWAPGYRTFSTKCQNLIERLGDARPDNRRVVKISTRYFERPGLVRFRPGITP